MGSTRGPGTWCGGPGLRNPKRSTPSLWPGPSTGSRPTAGKPSGMRACPCGPRENGQRALPMSSGDNVPELARLHRPRKGWPGSTR